MPIDIRLDRAQKGTQLTTATRLKSQTPTAGETKEWKNQAATRSLQKANQQPN
jgi:hypothetical protein